MYRNHTRPFPHPFLTDDFPNSARRFLSISMVNQTSDDRGAAASTARGSTLGFLHASSAGWLKVRMGAHLTKGITPPPVQNHVAIWALGVNSSLYSYKHRSLEISLGQHTCEGLRCHRIQRAEYTENGGGKERKANTAPGGNIKAACNVASSRRLKKNGHDPLLSLFLPRVPPTIYPTTVVIH